MTKDIDMEEMDNEMEILVLVNEEGKEEEFVHIATIDYNDDWFIFLQPVKLGNLEDDEMIILKIESDAEGNDLFVPVEDQDLIDKVYAEFVKELAREDCECDGECDCDCDCGCNCNKD